MRKRVAKPFFQGPLKVHLFSSLDGDAHGFIKRFPAAGASLPPEKPANLKHTLPCNRSQLSLVSLGKEKSDRIGKSTR